jgi:peptidoglycan hydrolase-like protein with peptidoglycan-binding domain
MGGSEPPHQPAKTVSAPPRQPGKTVMVPPRQPAKTVSAPPRQPAKVESEPPRQPAKSGSASSSAQLTKGGSPTTKGPTGLQHDRAPDDGGDSVYRIAKIQRALKRMGFYPGPVDNVAGVRTRSAIIAYQRHYGLKRDGKASLELLRHLKSVTLPQAEPRHGDGLVSSRFSDSPHMDDTKKIQAQVDQIAPSFRVNSTPTSKPRYVKTDSASEAEDLWQVFTPSRPQKADQMFIGRESAIERIICAIEEEHAHIVIYGSGGVGKTSLGNIIAESANDSGYHVARCTCDSETTFEQLFGGFLRGLPVDLMDRSIQGNGLHFQSSEQALPAGKLGPRDLANTFGHLIERVILIIDEFDRVRDENFKRKMSEAIKVISDSTDLLTVVIMGIGQSLDELLGHHLSVQRQITAIRLPLMEDAEVQMLLCKGEIRAGINFDDVVRDSIVTLSKGTPYYVHLLALLAGRHGLARNSKTIVWEDLRAAILEVLSETDPNVVRAYEDATRAETNLFMTDSLFAAAVAPMDRYGKFDAEGALKALDGYTGQSHQILNISRGLTHLSKNEKSRILPRTNSP